MMKKSKGPEKNRRFTDCSIPSFPGVNIVKLILYDICSVQQYLRFVKSPPFPERKKNHSMTIGHAVILICFELLQLWELNQRFFGDADAVQNGTER